MLYPRLPAMDGQTDRQTDAVTHIQVIKRKQLYIATYLECCSKSFKMGTTTIAPPMAMEMYATMVNHSFL